MFVFTSTSNNHLKGDVLEAITIADRTEVTDRQSVIRPWHSSPAGITVGPIVLNIGKEKPSHYYSDKYTSCSGVSMSDSWTQTWSKSAGDLHVAVTCVEANR